MALAKAGLLVACLTMLGNVLGFTRDVVLAMVYGANASTDAYVAAWTVPETFSPLLMEGLIPIVLTPWLVKHARSRRELSAAASALLLPIMVTSTLLAGLVMLTAPILVSLLTPDLEAPALAVHCVILAAGTIPAISAAGVIGTSLRSGHVLVVPAVVYAAYNVGIIATIVVGGQRWGIAAAALGLTVGAVLMCVSQLPAFLFHVGFSRPMKVRGSSAWVALTIAVPTLVYLILRQSQVFVERNIGSRLGEGAVTYLNLAQKLGQLPVTLTLALALVAFPALARLGNEGRLDEAADLVTAILRTVVSVLITATAGLIMCADPVVSLAFGRGEFGPEAVRATSETLSVYSLGLVFQGVVTTSALALFAVRRRSWTPATHLGICLVVTVVAAVPLAARFGPPGMAGANALAIAVAATGLLVALHRRSLVRPRNLVAPAARMLLVNVVASGCFLAVMPLVSGSPFAHLAGFLIVLVLAAAAVDLLSRGRLRKDLLAFRHAS